ncbi:MAG: SUMF1/EgtB/PvdO family nonheme iron enzyme [Anaerolineae bacterium]|nr:SUMF1/EgtB/PvdO family nonheme iron enzyme [Anaerolineae bacterium]
MSELIGQMLGQYQLTSILGEGGMATVYRAHQPSMKRDVAIKVIESKLARNSEFVKRFEREAQTVANLDHPHILKVFDFGQQGDLIYLAMELKTGGTLAKYNADQLLSPERVAVLVTQIASALDYAHKRGVIHRDLKPQNVLLDEEGNAFLTDFGIAKLMQQDYTSLTQLGASMGTPAYMSPEQWQGSALDARSDLYALGVMVYETLAGKLPFSADTPASMMFAHLQQKPPSILDLRPSLPRHIQSVINVALAKDPDDRYQTAQAFAEAFSNAVSGKPFVPPEKPSRSPAVKQGASKQPPPRGRWLSLPLVIASALILILVVGGLALMVRGGTGGQPVMPAATETATPQAAALAATSEPSSTPIPPSETSVSTATPIPPSLTLTASSTPLPTDTPSATITITASGTPTWTPSATATLSVAQVVASLEAQDTAVAVIRNTLTATVWTQTPTITFTPSVNVTATIEAFQTQWNALTNTADARNGTATEAARPTNTRTFTLTATRTNTPTLTATNTRTRTPVPTSTPLPTQTSRPSRTPLSTRTSIPSATPVPTLTPMPVITRNEQWTPQIVTIEDVEMVLVPPGCFMMGSNTGNDNEKPMHEVCITKPFYLDRFEVTNGQFELKQGKARQVGRWKDSNRPRETITWAEADVYCRQRDGRLPTEAEWEYAARGPDNFIYPWGNEFLVVKAIYANGGAYQLAEVGETMRPEAQSWVGAYDMGGNAWEWIADFYRAYPSDKQIDPLNLDVGSDHVLRGGSSTYDGISVRAAFRVTNTGLANSYFGLRCARSS